MRVETDGFRFDFTDAIDAFVFDEKDSLKATFHGAPMKAVDIVAELPDAYIWVEIKDHEDVDAFDVQSARTPEETKKAQDSFRWLKNYLKYKYRDTYLFRHAELKVDKPIHYICLLSFDNALSGRLQKELKRELPVGRASSRWKTEIARSCQVLNLQRWNQNFPKWPVERVSPI